MITITSRKAKKKMVNVRGKSVEDVKSPEYECSDVVVVEVDGKKEEFPCRAPLVGYQTAVNHLIIHGKELHLKLDEPKAPKLPSPKPKAKPKKVAAKPIPKKRGE